MVHMVQVRKGLVQGLVPAWRSTGTEKSEVVEKCFRTGMVRLAHWCRLSPIAGKCSETALVRMVHLAQPKIRRKMRHPLHPWCAGPRRGAEKRLSVFPVFLFRLIRSISAYYPRFCSCLDFNRIILLDIISDGFTFRIRGGKLKIIFAFR